MVRPAEIAALPERLVRRFDRWQGRHRATAVPVAVVRKYADDRGSAMAGLFAHYAFLALFPLLILLLTVLDRLVERYPGLRRAVIDTVVGQLPLIGPVLRDQSSSLAATGLGLVVGVVGLLWGATGLYNSAQLAMSQVWNVEGVDRMGLPSRLLRSVILFLTLFCAAALAAVASIVDVVPQNALLSTVVGTVGSVATNIATLLVALRIVTSPVVPTARLVLPAALSGAAWWVLQMVGHWFVSRQLSRMSDLYGAFAYALGALTWLTLMARVIVFNVEVSVVTVNRLYPRRIAQPPLTPADRDVLDRIVQNERRRPEQHIEIDWDDTGGDGHRERSQGAPEERADPGRSGQQ